jgi:hypothetical protein
VQLSDQPSFVRSITTRYQGNSAILSAEREGYFAAAQRLLNSVQSPRQILGMTINRLDSGQEDLSNAKEDRMTWAKFGKFCRRSLLKMKRLRRFEFEFRTAVTIVATTFGNRGNFNPRRKSVRVFCQKNPSQQPTSISAFLTRPKRNFRQRWLHQIGRSTSLYWKARSFVWKKR